MGLEYVAAPQKELQIYGFDPICLAKINKPSVDISKSRSKRIWTKEEADSRQQASAFYLQIWLGGIGKKFSKRSWKRAHESLDDLK